MNLQNHIRLVGALNDDEVIGSIRHVMSSFYPRWPARMI